jgi:hypothetical protein
VTAGRLIIGCTLAVAACSAQNAQISGLIQDPSVSKVVGAEITVRNEQTGGKRVTTSNRDGYYSVFSLRPGSYRISVRATGFETIVRDDIKLDVAEKARLDFNLRIGDSHTEVTVHGGPPLINTEDASVGTVIDRDTIEQMPLNGRGIQSLIELSPGVTVTPVVDSSRGQFAVNGQRTDANYITVDGVSANFAAGDASSQIAHSLSFTLSQSGGGMLPANNFLGTFSNLVSPDALQEFRIETSTFAPEYGRSPGAQIGLITRSGTNQYSGSLFEYFRNDKTDANDWFSNQQGLPRSPLRFNDFGGTLGGPLRIPHVYNGHDRTFFFVSAENLVMLQPQPLASAPVPTMAARQNAPPLVAAVLDAFPLPNRSSNPDGSDPAVTGLLPYVGSHSLLADQQTYGIRFDHSFSDKLLLFARYNRAPSERLASLTTSVEDYALGTETLTFGLTHILTPHVVNEIRLNASRQSAAVSDSVDQFAGAKTPPDSVVLPPGYSSADSAVIIVNLADPTLNSSVAYGRSSDSDRGRQLQFVDNLSWSKGSHLLKVGVDYKWFFPVQAVFRAFAEIVFNGIYGPSGIYSGVVPTVPFIATQAPSIGYAVPAFSSYAQDTWKINKKLTLTYGLRWDVDLAPRLTAGQADILGGISNLNNLASGYILPFGKPFYPTSWSNVAPRLGIGWQILNTSVGKTVLRAGAGRYFDLGQGGFEDSGIVSGVMVEYLNQPLGAIGSGQPTGVQPYTSALQAVAAAPGYNVPTVYQWNVTLEQSIGQQTFSAGYVGALDRRLTRYALSRDSFLPSTSEIVVVGDNGSSSYEAMQLQFNRRLFSRVGFLLSYTWSHSIDNLSSDAEQFNMDPTIQSLAQYFQPNMDRGPSDFDIRHSLSGSLIAPLPSPHRGIQSTLFRNWSANSIFFARSALPTDVLSSNKIDRPDVVPGEPLYLHGSEYPGGKSYNDAAFADPPAGMQGNLGRNVLRGFGAWQIDFALHRTFRLSERTNLQFRAEAFNIFNHPNFANPSDFGDPTHLTLAHHAGFGTSSEMLATGLSQTSIPGGLNPLFQVGGPRSMQFALRLHF